VSSYRQNSRGTEADHGTRERRDRYHSATGTVHALAQTATEAGHDDLEEFHTRALATPGVTDPDEPEPLGG
jgi:hypothetical protein